MNLNSTREYFDEGKILKGINWNFWNFDQSMKLVSIEASGSL